jgi:hypothetical protein
MNSLMEVFCTAGWFQLLCTIPILCVAILHAAIIDYSSKGTFFRKLRFLFIVYFSISFFIVVLGVLIFHPLLGIS